jgi:lipoyl(octanoyl) transferase
MLPTLIIRDLGLCDYETTYQAMKDFTLGRDEQTPDEIWLLEHPPVFTQGLTSKEKDLLNTGDIPVVAIDRGGQVTYHGPGQVIAYVLIDLPRRNLGVKNLVSRLEQTIIDLIAHYGVSAQRRENAPGVYVNGAKIASLGLRVKKGRSYHGLSLNVAMELEPFARIVPCGLQGIEMTQLCNFVPDISIQSVKQQLITHLLRQLGYNSASTFYETTLPHKII